MTTTITSQDLQEKFQAVFGEKTDHTFFSPGRINLIGEHTDYNGGHVFPAAITLGTYGAARKREDKVLRFFSGNFEDKGIIEVPLENLHFEKEHNWTNYPKGVLHFLQEAGHTIDSGMDIYIYGNIPNGSGLSSSSSLELLIGVIAEKLYDLKLERLDLVKIGKQTENDFIGVNSGIMDQFASVFGKAGSLIRLDCRSLEYKYYPFNPVGYKLVLLDSVVKHELASSAYNKRRKSCENVVAAIRRNHPEVEFLRDATMEMLNEVKADVSAEDYMRAEYVIEEIQRVLDVCAALEKGDYETVGEKMYGTHQGMSKLYEVSCEELDFLNDIAKECGVTGSRVMGGGFGGCTINLVKDELYDDFVKKAFSAYKEKFGREPKLYNVVISDGARKLC